MFYARCRTAPSKSASQCLSKLSLGMMVLLIRTCAARLGENQQTARQRNLRLILKAATVSESCPQSSFPLRCCFDGGYPARSWESHGKLTVTARFQSMGTKAATTSCANLTQELNRFKQLHTITANCCRGKPPRRFTTLSTQSVFGFFGVSKTFKTCAV